VPRNASVLSASNRADSSRTTLMSSKTWPVSAVSIYAAGPLGASASANPPLTSACITFGTTWIVTLGRVARASRRSSWSAMIRALSVNRRSAGRISALTAIPQGRLSEYRTGKRKPQATSVFEAFADGIGMPPAARRALGLAAGSATLPSGASTTDDTKLSYPDNAPQATENLSALWRTDLADATAFQRGRFDPRTWDTASLRWLVHPGSAPDESPTGVRIGMSDVTRFRATVDLFDTLDGRFGGGHARESLIKYLSVDADRLLRGRYSAEVGRELFSAVGEATLLAAWMTYDSAPASSLAQSYFVQALALAQAGNDRLLGASILDAMSHQATFAGRYTDAANLARAARTGMRGLASPTQTAHFHAMEARALARLGDAKACSAALSASVTEFERANPDNAPAWIRYFNESELSAEFGHCMRPGPRIRCRPLRRQQPQGIRNIRPQRLLRLTRPSRRSPGSRRRRAGV
jgi:hypothetical protein